jgi:hypothetical protein
MRTDTSLVLFAIDLAATARIASAVTIVAAARAAAPGFDDLSDFARPRLL